MNATAWPAERAADGCKAGRVPDVCERWRMIMLERQRCIGRSHGCPRMIPLGLALLLYSATVGATVGFGQGAEAPPTQAEPTAVTVPAPEAPVPGRSLEGPIDPARYRLGPGDLLNVRIRLRPPIDRILRLSPEGFLILPEGASVALAGIPLARAESTVTAVLCRYYKNPEVELHLLELRTFGVFIVGEVPRPGLVEATAVDRASEVIERAGGLTLTTPAGRPPREPSSRAILLTRTSGEVLPVDVGLFEATGALFHNPVVEAGDRIYVPPRTATVTVSGALRKTGEVEVAVGDSVATLIALAHGLREDALEDSAYLESFEGAPLRSRRHYLNLRSPADRRSPIHERDLLFVRSRSNWTQTRSVVVKGEVLYPGVHALPADSLPLTKVIQQAGGFTNLASLQEAYLLRKQDKLPPDPEFERLSKLSTSEMTPDEYEYYSLKLRTQKPVVSVDFAALFGRGERSYDVSVRPGDEINIPRVQPYVMVVGEVARPGNLPYVSELTVDQYIALAGGYTWRASKGNVSVIRALTGEWAKKGKARWLGPGDTIWIPRRPRRNYVKGALDAIGFLSQLATIYLVISNAVGK